MEVIAKGKSIRISPKKAREIADLIRGKGAKESRAMLKFMPQKSAGVIDKILASAMANAEANFNLDKSQLTITKITVDGGPVLKRWQPRAKGAAFEIKKRSSHITIIVSGDVTTKKAAPKKETAIEAPKEIKEEKSDNKPEFIQKEQKGSREVAVKKQVFRRKTG